MNAQRLFVVAAAAAGMIVVGVFGPWTEVTLLSSVSVTENGFDGSNLGWLLIVLAVLGAAAAWAAATRGQFWAAAAVLACGVVATAVAVATRGDLDEGEFAGLVDRDVGWGPTVAVIGAIVLGLVGLGLLWLDRRAVTAPAEGGEEPSTPGSRPAASTVSELSAGDEQRALGRGAIPMPAADERALPRGDLEPADQA